MDKKITVVGAGNVGTTTAQLIAEKNLADVVLIDIVEGIPQGKALDIQEACPLWLSSSRVTGTNSYSDTADSDIVIVTAGLARKPGMSRDELLKANAGIVRQVSENISRTSPGAIVIVVSNPMDAMAYVAWKITGFSSQKVIGMGGILDSSRMRSFISMELDAPPEDIHATVLGGHGDLMVPLPRLTTVKGKCLTELLPETKVNEIIDRTKNGGAEIVSLLKTGSAYYAPAASVVEMIEAVFGLKTETVPCSVYLDGKYGVRGVYLGVPVKLSSCGVDEIVEIDLSDEEKQAMKKSAEAVRTLMEKIKDI